MDQQPKLWQKFLTLWGLIIMFSLFCAPAMNAEILKVVTGAWCPYLCASEDPSAQKGYLIDLFIAIFEKENITVETTHIPLTRAHAEVRKGTFHVLPGLPEGIDPLLLNAKKPEGVSVNYFFVHKDNLWRYSEPASLLQITRLGLGQGYQYPPELDQLRQQHPEKIQEFTGLNVSERMLQLILKQRIDVVFDDLWVLKHAMHTLGITQDIVQAGTLGQKYYMYSGFSPAHPKSKEYIQIWQTGIERLRQSGELDKILSQYGIQDWLK